MYYEVSCSTQLISFRDCLKNKARSKSNWKHYKPNNLIPIGIIQPDRGFKIPNLSHIKIFTKTIHALLIVKDLLNGRL